MELLVLCCLLGGGLGLSLPELTLTIRLQDVARNIPTRCVEHSVTPVSCADVRNSDALVAHPDDCQLFYYCEESRSSPTCRQCPDGLHFNPTLHVCDWPQSASCTPQAPATTTTAAPNTITTAAPTTTAAPNIITTTAAAPNTTTAASPTTDSPHNTTKPSFNFTTSYSTNNLQNTTKPSNGTRPEFTPTIPSNGSAIANTSSTRPYSTTTALPSIVNSTEAWPSNVTWVWTTTTGPSNSTSNITAWEPLNGNDHRANITWPQDTRNNSSNYSDNTSPGSSPLPTGTDIPTTGNATVPSPTASEASSNSPSYTTSRPLNSTTKAPSTPVTAPGSFRHTTLGWRLWN